MCLYMWHPEKKSAAYRIVVLCYNMHCPKNGKHLLIWLLRVIMCWRALQVFFLCNFRWNTSVYNAHCLSFMEEEINHVKKVLSINVVISCKPLGIISYLLGNSNAGCDYATGILHCDSHRGWSISIMNFLVRVIGRMLNQISLIIMCSRWHKRRSTPYWRIQGWHRRIAYWHLVVLLEALLLGNLLLVLFILVSDP